MAIVGGVDPDHELVEKACQGDHRAFELLVAKYQRRVFRVVVRFMGQNDEVDDVAQEAFLNAYRGLPQFRRESRFSTWLFTIAANTARRWLQDRAKRQTYSLSDESDPDQSGTFSAIEALTDAATPDSVLANKQLAVEIELAIADLSDDFRNVMLMRDLDGMSYEQIASALACPVGTVRSRLYRAREEVARRIKPLLSTKSGKRW